MNVFSRLLAVEHMNDTRLGVPANSEAQGERRLSAMAALTGGKGFRVPAISVRVYADGKTRGDRKRTARAAANAKVSESRPLQFQHSSRGQRT
jgi:hypothetical protein